MAKKAKPRAQTIAKKTVPAEKKTTDDWISPNVFIILGIIFLIVQIVGLYAAKQLFILGMQQAPFTDNINDIENSIYMFIAMMVMTAVILIILKLRKTKKLLWFVEILAICSTSIVLFSAIFPTNDLIVLALTALILFFRYTNRTNIFIRDIASMIAITGAGAFLGISFGLIPILVFIIILAIYDIIAVFYTKHMVEIGRAATQNNFAFTVAIPTKKHTFELGNGDLVIPLMVGASILINAGFHNNGLVAGLVLGASFVGLLTSIYTVSVKKIPLPALPPQTVLMVLTIGAAILLGL